jgi:hypothetical protein
MGDEPKPVVKLVGEDGNVFNLIGLVQRALKTSLEPEKAQEFSDRVFIAQSYDEVLRLAMEYVEIV